MATHPAESSGNPISAKKEFLLFISIPISIIVLVAAIVLGPSLFAKPNDDFIYSLCPDYSCSGTYQVNGYGNLYQSYSASNVYSSKAPELYYYSSANNSSKRVEFIDAQAYVLNSSNVSPDGYILTQNNNSDSGLLFWGYSGGYNWYLKNGSKKKQVNLVNNTYYGDNLRFLGWVKK